MDIRQKIIAVILLLGSMQSISAQTPDSVFIHGNYLDFIYNIGESHAYSRFKFSTNTKIKKAAKPGCDFAATLQGGSSVINAVSGSLSNHMQHKNSQFWGAYNELEFNVDFNSLLAGNQLSDCVFFAPDRYILLEEGRYTYKSGDVDMDFPLCKVYNWMQYSIDSLNIVVLFEGDYYSRRDDEPLEIRCIRDIIVPLKNGRYLCGDHIETLQRDTIGPDYSNYLWSRQHILDVDTLAVAGKYGLYTLTGREVIPPIYDSISQDEVLIRAFTDDRVIFYDYLGNVRRSNIRRAFPYAYHYHVIDDNNRVYWLDRDGKERISFQYWAISSDDMVYSEKLPFDAVITPPAKKKRLRKNHHWVSLQWLWDTHDNTRLTDKNRFIYDPGTTDEKLLRGFLSMSLRRDFEQFESSGLFDYLDEQDKDREKKYPYLYSSGSYISYVGRFFYYDIDGVFEIPSVYKNPVLVNGKNEYSSRCELSNLLRSSHIIARFKGKYGMLDARNPETPVLPFEFDKIDPHGHYLILYKKGLKCYYPISDTPRYTELGAWGDFMRFTLPDGRQGWLLKNGEEFPDQCQTVTF